jgi:two-component system, cell cycle response regulator
VKTWTPPALAAVGDRLLVLQLVRVLGAAAILIVPLVVGDSRFGLVPLALAYLLVTGAVELLRRRKPERSATLLSGTVMVDGMVVALAVAMTGGYVSPLLFLVFLDVMAVTVLASYRTGLKLAIWCALLLLLGHAAAEADLVNLDASVSDRVALVSAATFLLFAFAAAAFSSVNERTLRHSRAQLETLVQLGTDLERAHRFDEVMEALVHHSCSRLGFARAAVLVRRGDRWHGVVDDGTMVTLLETADGPAPLVWEAWERGAPILVRALDDDLLDAVLPAASNVIVAPVIAEDETIGVAVGEWGGDADASMPSLTVQAFAQSAMHTALALRNAALLDEVERLATRDGLTGLANRRLFEESLERETARSSRLRTPLSLLILDVDHFKQINDTYGHPAGDAVLREIGTAVAGSTKAFDVAARYGGDEFVVLLPGCTAVDASGVADRVRSEIAHQVIDLPVTVSVGVATMPDNALDAERLVAAADGALYEAKRSGRDRTHASTRTADRPSAERVQWRAPLARGA